MTPTKLTPRLQKRKAALDSIPPFDRSIEAGTLQITRRFRGLTIDQAMRYLESLGGTRGDDAAIEGDGWRADLSARKVPVGPSYRLT
ncbi:MAG: hypothetical protein ACQETB_07670, partial [Halobacteriota archaeon]